MMHYIADEMAEVLHLDIECYKFECAEYILTVFDWVADFHANLSIYN